MDLLHNKIDLRTNIHVCMKDTLTTTHHYYYVIVMTPGMICKVIGIEPYVSKPVD